MSDYAPVFMPGMTFTSVAATPVTGGDPLEVAGPGTVRRCTTPASPAYVGIAAADAVALAEVTVFAARPVYDGPADGTITAGQQVIASETAGRQVKALATTATTFAGTYSAADAQAAVNAAVNAARSVIGIALTTATDGNPIRWQQR